MENTLLNKLLQKYTKGECTPEERDLVDAWFEQMDKNPDDLRLLDERLEKKLGEKMLVHIKIRASSASSMHRPLFRAKTLYRIAAAILLLCIVGAGAVFIGESPGIQLQKPVTYSSEPRISITNTTNAARKLFLTDGTTILLQPRGTVSYSKDLTGNRRDVQLRGEAFFDVAKDKDRPFVISTENVTVKVLGTSFSVKAYENAEEVTVAVKTGRVSVFAKDPDTRQVNTSGKKEIILTPNQEVVYNTIHDNFLKKIVAQPQIILAKPTLFEMNYDGMPVDKIFEVLEDNYGIDIVFDKEVLSSCTLTTSMAEEGFYERIAIICHAIGAQYDVKDATIVVKSAGCQ